MAGNVSESWGEGKSPCQNRIQTAVCQALLRTSLCSPNVFSKCISTHFTEQTTGAQKGQCLPMMTRGQEPACVVSCHCGLTEVSASFGGSEQHIAKCVLGIPAGLRELQEQYLLEFSVCKSYNPLTNTPDERTEGK